MVTSPRLAFEAGAGTEFHASCDAVADAVDEDVTVGEADTVANCECVGCDVSVDVEERVRVPTGASLSLPVLVSEIDCVIAAVGAVSPVAIESVEATAAGVAVRDASTVPVDCIEAAFVSVPKAGVDDCDGH